MYQSSVLTATIVQFPQVSHSGSFFALEFLWETEQSLMGQECNRETGIKGIFKRKRSSLELTKPYQHYVHDQQKILPSSSVSCSTQDTHTQSCSAMRLRGRAQVPLLRSQASTDAICS